MRAPAGFVFMLVLTLMPARVSAQSVSDVQGSPIRAAPGDTQRVPRQTAGLTQRSTHGSPSPGIAPQTPMPSDWVG